MTTRLNALNIMLSTIGEPPITAENSTNLDAAMAGNILDEVTKEVQKMGWVFNTEEGVSLATNPDGEIPIGNSVLRLKIEEQVTRRRYVHRGDRIYDTQRKSYIIGGPLKATIIRNLVWDKLPEDAKRYITIRASRIFANRMVGDGESHGYTTMDEMQARADLREMELDSGDYSMLDALDMQRAFNRGTAVRRWSN
jgi:hypothetical protein